MCCNCKDVYTNAILTNRQYVEFPYISRNCDLLRFWRDKNSTFPKLYKLHAKYVCIPETSVPCERVFSKSGLINDRRNGLCGKNLNSIINF